MEPSALVCPPAATLAFKLFVAGWNIPGKSANFGCAPKRQSVPNSKQQAARQNCKKTMPVVARRTERYPSMSNDPDFVWRVLEFIGLGRSASIPQGFEYRHSTGCRRNAP